MRAISALATGHEYAQARGAARQLDERVAETAELTDRRGYGLTVEEFARLLYGGHAPAELVRAAVERSPTLMVLGDLVVRRDRAGGVPAMLERHEKHQAHVQTAEALAVDFAGRLASSCPLVRSVSLTGSAASGGFTPRDDVDLNLVVRDGSKYTAYLWSIALSAVTSLRNRRVERDEMGALPFLPKIICINVVWEEHQVRPFARQDKWLAYELLMHRPLLGARFWASVLEENEWISEHFPQVFEAGPESPSSTEAERLSATRRRGRRLFAFLDEHPRVLSAIEPLARTAVIALHKLVSILRTRRPEAREREAFVNMVKRPYSVYDFPGREDPVPPEALSAREATASPLP